MYRLYFKDLTLNCVSFYIIKILTNSATVNDWKDVLDESLLMEGLS